MGKWEIVAFIGVAIMTVSASVGTYLNMVGFEVTFHTIMAIWIGAIIATVAFVSWGEEKGLEESVMKEILSKYKLAEEKPKEKIKTEVYAKSFGPITSAFFYIIPFFTGFSICALVVGIIYRSLEAIIISLVLTVFLAWLYRWAKRTQEKWKKISQTSRGK